MKKKQSIMRLSWLVFLALLLPQLSVTAADESLVTSVGIETSVASSTLNQPLLTEAGDITHTTTEVVTADTVVAETTVASEVIAETEPAEHTTVTSSVVEETTSTSETTVAADLRVIVETNNQSALNRAAYRDQAAFEKAKLEAEAEVEATFELIKSILAQDGLTLEKEKTFSATFTGFSAKVTQPVVEKLSLLKEVIKVTTQQSFTLPKAEPMMNSSVDMVGLNKLINEGLLYRGERMLVSVIDTGADPDHRDLVMGDDVPVKYTKEQMDALIAELGLPGKWYSNKIVYGYNYADETQTIKDRNEHGLHVAGTIGANGDPATGGIRGVAPHVQLLIMKAFSNNMSDESVYEDVWLKAIDDSIKLGADVINMSLGMPAGFSLDGDTPTAKAFRLARAKGILPVVAAGNDRNTTWGTDVNNLATNPDAGVLGYPAVVDESAAIASFENTRQSRRYMEAKYGDKVINFIGSDTYPEGFTPEFHEVVAIGRGLKEDYENLGLQEADLTGKYVLVQRGGDTFNVKYQNAIARGAAGVIIYDNADAEQPMNMTGLENLGAPVMFITLKSGEQLLDLMKNHQDLTVRIPEGISFFANPLAGRLSEFTSWGPTTDLRLKPDLAAPGGNIYSLMSDNRYQNMSGTSMATPHIAGLAALIMQRLYQDHLLTGDAAHRDSNQDDLALLMLMNTAQPVLNGNSYYSPIQQGAGLVNIYNAIKNFVTVTAVNSVDTHEDGKLEMKEVGNQFDATLKLTNHGREAVTYHIEYVLLKDLIDENQRYTGNTEIRQRSHIGSVTVAAGQSVEFSKMLSTLGIDANQFVQGYFLLSADNDSAPDLSVPFLGYKGKWDQPAIFDEMLDFSEEERINYIPVVNRDDNGNVVAVEKAGFVQPGKNGGWQFWNEWKAENENTVFVNNGDNGNYHSSVAPVLSPLRDAVNLKFQIVDENGKVVRQLFLADRIFKTNGLYKENKRYDYLRLMDGAAWDFKDSFGEFVKEGIYYYEITGAIDSPNATPQTYKYRLVYDNTPSEMKAEKTGNQLLVEAKDDLAGLNLVTLYNPITGAYEEIVVDKADKPRLLADKFSFDLPAEGFDKGKIIVTVIDNAGNKREQIIEISDETLPEDPTPEEPTDPEEPAEVDETEVAQEDVNPADYPKEEGLTTAELPKIEMESPFNYEMFSNQNVPLNALIYNFDEVHRVVYRVKDSQGNEIVAPTQGRLVKRTKDGVSELRLADEIAIDKLTASDQYIVEVTFYGKSIEGNLVANTVANRFRVDKIAPKLSVKQVAGPDDNLLYFEIEYDENMNYVEVWANNNMLVRDDKTYDSLKPIRVGNKLVYTLPKSEIGKEVTFAAYDDAKGNESIVKVTLEELPKVTPKEPLPPIEIPVKPGDEEEPKPVNENGKDETKDPVDPDKEKVAKLISELEDKLNQADNYRWPEEWNQDVVAKLVSGKSLDDLDATELAALQAQLEAANNRIVRYVGAQIPKGQHFGAANQPVQASQVLPATGEQTHPVVYLLAFVCLSVAAAIWFYQIKRLG